jgi:transposase
LPSKLPINWQGARRGEVLPWPERRRWWSWEEKAQIVAESLAPNAVASAIAGRYGLHRNQLYAWRKELSQTANGAAEAGGPAPLDFVPVVAQVFTALFNLAMRLERERFLGAGP